MRVGVEDGVSGGRVGVRGWCERCEDRGFEDGVSDVMVGASRIA